MAITYGMSVKEFWDDDPDLFWAYRFSYFNRQKDDYDMFNNHAWLQGQYIYEAVSVAINNCFGEKKREYAKYPYGTPEEEIKKIEELEFKKQQERLIAQLEARAVEVSAIVGKRNGSTTKEGNAKGGEKQ